jgi:DNA-3-methyladenine glycosylase II
MITHQSGRRRKLEMSSHEKRAAAIRDSIFVERSPDSTMLALVSRYGELRLKRRPPFVVLSRSIIAQQISTKAADTIRGRLAGRFGSSPNVVASAPLTSLRELGLSEPKALSIRDVAVRATEGEFDGFEHLSDEAVIGQLCAIRGIGMWTAEMFLIFALARPDVWPLADAGLRSAAIRLYRAEDRPAIERLGSRFSPRRSIAALYLWKSLENTTSTSY